MQTGSVHLIGADVDEALWLVSGLMGRSQQNSGPFNVDLLESGRGFKGSLWQHREEGERKKNFNTRAETAKAPVHKNCPNKLLLTDVSFGSQVKDDVDVFGTEDVVQQPRVTHIPLLKKSPNE